jgi:integrase/recombinase XerD
MTENSLNLVRLTESYAICLSTEGKSRKTIEWYSNNLNRFDRFLESPGNISEIKTEDLRRYIRHLQSRQKWHDHPTIRKIHGPLSPHAVATYARTIRAFFSWLTREGFLENNPFSNVKLPKVPRKVIPTLTSEKAVKFFRAIPQDNAKGYRDFAFLLTLYGTGLRLSELTGLRKENVNFDNAQLKILGKGAKERVVSMSARVYKVLFKYQTTWRPRVESTYFFIDSQGKPFTRFVIAHRMKTYFRKSGINLEKCTPHTLRHSFAVQFLRNGGDVFSL